MDLLAMVPIRAGKGRVVGWGLAAALLIGLALGALAVRGPGLASAHGTAVLRQAGFPEASLRVERIGPMGAAGEVILAPGQGVDRFTASYTPWGLLTGRFDRLEIAGLHLRLLAGPDGLALAGRQRLAGPPSGLPARLPFRQLAVTDALIAIAGADTEVLLPLQATVEAAGSDLRLVAGFASPAHAPGIAGKVHLRWAASGTPEGVVDLEVHALPVAAGLTLDGGIQYEGDTRRLRATLRMPRAAEIAIDGHLDAGVRLTAEIPDLARLGRVAGVGLAGEGRVVAETLGAWGAVPPPVRIDARLHDVAFAGLVTGAGLAGAAQLSRNDGGWRLEAAAPVDLSFAPAPGVPLPPGGWRLSWAPGRTAPAALEWRQGPGGLHLTASGDLAIAGAGLSGGISLEPSELVLDQQGWRSASLAIVDGALSAGGAVPSGHALRLAATYDRSASPALTAELRGTLGGGESGWLPRLDLTGEVRGDPAERLPFTLQAQGLGGALRLDLRGAHDGSTGRGAADLTVRPFSPTKPAELAPALAAWFREGKGIIGLKASFGWGKGGRAGKAELMLKDVALTGDKAGVEQLNAVLTATSLVPLVMPAGQLVSVGVVRAGIPLQNGQIGFGIDRDGVLNLERADFAWAGGRVRAQPMRAALGEPRWTAVLDAAGLDLAQLLALAPVEGLAVTGTLSGQIPVTFEAGTMRLDQGRLVAAGPGTIRYDPANPPAFLQSNENAALLTQALANFQYTELALTLEGALGADMRAGLHIRGKNPEFYGGYPVNLNLNISGALMSILRQGVGAYQLPDQVRERLEQFGRTP